MLNLFNASAIGQKLKTERVACGYKSQDALAEKMNVCRQTVASWERGENLNLGDLVRLCNLFSCDFGYIVGEYECKRRTATDIREETGLSASASLNLSIIANARFDGAMDEIIISSTRENLREYEIGRFAKIRFIEALLENDDLLEKLAVNAFDYLSEMRKFNIDTFHTENGVRHDQLANLAKQNAQETLSSLFIRIADEYSGQRYDEWTKEGTDAE